MYIGSYVHVSVGVSRDQKEDTRSPGTLVTGGYEFPSVVLRTKITCFAEQQMLVTTQASL